MHIGKSGIIFFIFLYFMTQNKLFAQGFDWQGHRGARGLLSENTLPAFEKALELGVVTLEMDVVISRDRQIVVSHDPWMNPSICIQPSGEKINPEEYRKFNLFGMTYEEVRSYDCGSIGNPGFPEQNPVNAYKPLLKDVFKLAEKYCKDHMRNEILYNIEIKSSPDWDGIFTPTVEEFSRLVFNEVDAYVPWKRVCIQSFDLRVLKYFHSNYPEVKLAVLVENDTGYETVIKNLGFTPHVYSPYYKLIDKQKIKAIHKTGMRIIPWTVNDPDEMEQLVDWGVDGIITDYPDRIFEVHR